MISLPVLRLRASGYCSPTMCTTTDEEVVFARAADEIQSVPIVWHRKIQPKKITQCQCSSSSGEASSSCSSSSCNSNSIGTKNVEVEQNYNEHEHSNRTGTSITGSPRSVVTALSAGSSSSQDKYSTCTEYMRFDAVMSLCDTESGPALEIRTKTSASRKILRTLETSDLADFDETMDVVSILKSSKSKSKSKPQSKDANANANANAKNANKRHVKFEEDEDAVIERIIPLDVIECAAPGGAGVFDWENIFNVGSGNLDCSVKVYSSANEYQLIGSGKKVLLFDVPNEAKLTRDEIVDRINTLVSWNDLRQQYLHQTGDGDLKGNKRTGGARPTVSSSCCL